MRAVGARHTRVVEERPNTIFVGNIPYGVTEQQLYKLFHRFGKITKHQYLWHRKGERRGVPKGFCFVEYEKQESSTRARLAMNGRMLCGRKIVVSHAQRKVGIMNKNWNKRGDPPDDRNSRNASNVSNDDKIRAIRRKLANMQRTSSAKSRVHEAIAKQSVSLAPNNFTLTPATASPSSSSSSSKKRKRQRGDAKGDEGEDVSAESEENGVPSSSLTSRKRHKVVDRHGEDGASISAADASEKSNEATSSSSQTRKGHIASVNDTHDDNVHDSSAKSKEKVNSSYVAHGGDLCVVSSSGSASSSQSSKPLALPSTDEDRSSASVSASTKVSVQRRDSTQSQTTLPVKRRKIESEHDSPSSPRTPP